MEVAFLLSSLIVIILLVLINNKTIAQKKRISSLEQRIKELSEEIRIIGVQQAEPKKRGLQTLLPDKPAQSDLPAGMKLQKKDQSVGDSETIPEKKPK